jgi:hypothetical protein
MRAVLYSEFDLEPITVLTVAPWMIALWRKGCPVRLAGIPPISLIADPRFPALDVVDIYGDLLRHGRLNAEMWFLTTKDDRAALLLRSAFLPGQAKEVDLERSKAFVKGFMKAWEGLLGGPHA